MHYANPDYMTIIFVPAILVFIFYLWASRRRRSKLERFADRSLIGSIAPSMSIARRTIKASLVVAGIVLMLVALARPQWGFEWQEVKRTGLDIMIAMDVSKSMLANDVKPNRLERSKFAVKDLVKKLDGDRMGLIAFAGTSFLQCPLTIDYNGFLLSLDDLSVFTIPRGGTSISSAIREAMQAFSQNKTDAANERKYRVLVVITDGEDFEGDALAAAKEAAAAGVKIFCVGVGTPEGELIPVSEGYTSKEYLLDKTGEAVKTRLNEDILKEIAISTGGSYVRATQGDFGLVLLYEKSISRLEKRDIEAKMKKSYQERFQYFLGAAVLLLLAEMLLSERKRSLDRQWQILIWPTHYIKKSLTRRL
ncbi:MAG: VWA domain-containing protein [Candidatus Omnitrophica bacterium]|nr:VWA domain-containing protein [Candidatus Omnitrophota bacterium]